MKTKNLQWVGGPDDGDWLVDIPNEVTTINIVIQEYMDYSNPPDEDNVISTSIRICPVKGNKIYWHGLPD